MPEKAQAELTSTGASAGNNDPHGVVQKILGYPKIINPEKYVFSQLWDFENNRYHTPDRQGRIVIWDQNEPFLHNQSVTDCPIQTSDILLTLGLSYQHGMIDCKKILYFDMYIDINHKKICNDRFDKIADILLGNPKPIRMKMFERLKKYGLLEDNLINLFGVYRSPDMPSNELEKIITDTQDSMTIYNGNWASQSLPIDIYKRTAVSFIAESDPRMDMFITEKTFKPIFAGRPFFGLQCKGAMSFLKTFGFETFDKWWDETYDTLDDHMERADACIDILKQLQKENLSLILQDMQDVIDHNYNITKKGMAFFNKDAIDYLNNLT